jgi:hypothetical protein
MRSQLKEGGRFRVPLQPQNDSRRFLPRTILPLRHGCTMPGNTIGSGKTAGRLGKIFTHCWAPHTISPARGQLC